jgi:hypothetical protein
MRFRIRTLLLVTAVVAVGVLLAPHFVFPRLHHELAIRETTPGGTKYFARIMVETRRFQQPRLVNVVIWPGVVTDWEGSFGGLQELPDGRGLEQLPHSVFYRRKRVGGYGNERVVVLLKEDDARSITLSPSETAALLAMPPGDLQASDLWQHVILPKLDDMLEAASENSDGAAGVQNRTQL